MRRDAGAVERGGLENRCAFLRYPGFESLSLRHQVSGAVSLTAIRRLLREFLVQTAGYETNFFKRHRFPPDEIRQAVSDLNG